MAVTGRGPERWYSDVLSSPADSVYVVGDKDVQVTEGIDAVGDASGDGVSERHRFRSENLIELLPSGVESVRGGSMRRAMISGNIVTLE